MDGPEEIKQLSRRISGGPHDGEGPELNLWPRSGWSRYRRVAVSGKVRLPLAAVMLVIGVYDVLAEHDYQRLQGALLLVWAPLLVWEVVRARRKATRSP